MNPLGKKMLHLSIVLSSIGVAAAILISGTYLLTKDRVALNQKIALEKALKDSSKPFIQGKEVNFEKGEKELSSWKNRQYVGSYYLANENDSPLAYCFLNEGKNQYGNIKLVISFSGLTKVGEEISGEVQYGRISFIEDGQSFKSFLEGNYVNPFNKSLNPDVLSDLHCGATYGSRLVKAMIDESLECYKWSL